MVGREWGGEMVPRERVREREGAAGTGTGEEANTSQDNSRTLPPGWEKVLSKSKNIHYYHNRAANRSVCNSKRCFKARNRVEVFDFLSLDLLCLLAIKLMYELKIRVSDL